MGNTKLVSKDAHVGNKIINKLSDYYKSIGYFWKGL